MTYIQRWDKNPGGAGGVATPAFEMEMSEVTGLAYVEYPYFWRVWKNKWGTLYIHLMKRHTFWWPTITLSRGLCSNVLCGYEELDPENIAYQSARALVVYEFIQKGKRRAESICGDYPPKKLKMGDE